QLRLGVQFAADALHVLLTERVHHATLEALDDLRLSRVTGRTGEERGCVERECGGTETRVVTRSAGDRVEQRTLHAAAHPGRDRPVRAEDGRIAYERLEPRGPRCLTEHGNAGPVPVRLKG